MFYVLYAFLWLIMWLPLPVIYVFSDLAWPIMYYVVRYRRRVVRDNLANSFPDKNVKELRRIERRFYRSFCDTMLESMYSIHMSRRELKRRFTYCNLELLDEALSRKQGCFVMTSHYGNYEWLTGAKLSMEKDYPYFTVYRRLANRHFDKVMSDVRQRRHNINVEKRDLMQVLEQNHRQGIRGIYGMIADQKPSPKKPQYWYWTTFLNQDTAFLTGTEFLARKYDYAVLYAHIERLGRGRYRCTLEWLSDEPRLCADNGITEKYARLLERDLQQQPAYWLWSHKRWKYKRTV